MTDSTGQKGFYFPERLVDQDSATARFYNDLLRGLTHKLNNLLAVIQGFTSLIMLQDDLDETVKENLKHMKEAGTGASNLGERVLPAGGCARIDIGEVLLRDSASMLITRLREFADKQHVPFRAKIYPDLPNVLGDQGKIRETLVELVKNAVEAAGPSGEVLIEILPPEDKKGPQRYVDVFVQNTGSQIPPDRMKDIFRPFYTTKDSSHYGLGLTTAYVLAGQMKMPLGVKSESHVTTFWLRMPVV